MKERSWKYDNRPLEIVSCYIYLGVHITSSGIWTECQKSKADQANKVLFRYWLKLVQMNSMMIAKNAYELQYRWAEKNEMCWALQVKQLLLSYGFGHVWFAQGVGNIDMFLHVFKQRCNDIFIQDWSSKMENMSRIQFLCQIK